ncbi:hypothetical protein Thiowin_03137 [Thiorhodovibrio winogradskyi]|uniref:Uncharacterized protein n=1 Tax=Thiorhodovibrio winogradskyi TaxID=77007 RepID=A0ABZ0SDE7_9GAMM
MRLCPKCSNSPWPFAMVALLASIITFLTWLILSYTQTPELTRVISSAAVFVGVSFSLSQYVLICLRRHCPHRHEGSNCHSAH